MHALVRNSRLSPGKREIAGAQKDFKYYAELLVDDNVDDFPPYTWIAKI